MVCNPFNYRIGIPDGYPGQILQLKNTNGHVHATQGFFYDVFVTF